jgi:hypothetical protein
VNGFLVLPLAGLGLQKKRAAVPGTAALGGCCYFNQPEGQRAQPEGHPQKPSEESHQGTIPNGYGCYSFLALLSLLAFFIGFAVLFTRPGVTAENSPSCLRQHLWQSPYQTEF